MKPSEALTRAINDLDDACQRIVAEKKAPLQRQVTLLQSLRFDTDNEAGRLSLEAATSEDPRDCLIRAAESLQRQDVLETAASLRGTVVQSLHNKANSMDADLKAIARLRNLATAAIEQATKAVIGRNVGGAQDFVASSVERHLQANITAAMGVIEAIRGSFHCLSLERPLQSVAEAFAGLLEAVTETEGV